MVSDDNDNQLWSPLPHESRSRRSAVRQPQSHQQSVTSIEPFKCQCKTRCCYQNVINEDGRLGRPHGSSFQLVRAAVATLTDHSRRGRTDLLIHVMDNILPKINGRAVCDFTVYKISGHSKRWWSPRSDEQKEMRNQKLRDKRNKSNAMVEPDEAHANVIRGGKTPYNVTILLWFLCLIPTLDHMPDLPFYQCPAPDRKVVHGWYLNDHQSDPETWPLNFIPTFLECLAERGF